MDGAKLIDLIENAGFTARSYSGPGMYGKRCVGIDVDRGDSPFKLVAEIIDARLCEDGVGEDGAGLDELLDVIRDARTDSMGRDTIVYFPIVGWPEERADADDGDEAVA